MIKACLIFVSILSGCLTMRLPTTTDSWQIVYAADSRATAGEQRATLEHVWVWLMAHDLPLLVSLDHGDMFVFVFDQSGSEQIGECATGSDCTVWRASSYGSLSPRDIAHVIIHEILHSYGLGHESTPGNVMVPVLEIGNDDPDLTEEQRDRVMRLLAPRPARTRLR